MNTQDHTDRARFWMRREAIERIQDRNYWTQEALADAVGISRVHFNRLLNRRRPLGRVSRRKLANCELLAGIPDNELWERLPPSPE
jgi:transcriptional regulator with XRE-family HTH domain